MTAASAAGGLAPEEFGALDGVCYLNAASSGPLPLRSRLALEDHVQRRAAGRLTEADFEPVLGRARAAAARLIDALPGEIALTPNTSVGLNLAAAFVLQQRADGDDRPGIVVSDREFPANMYAWLELERVGFEVRVVPCDALGRPDEVRLMEAVDRDDVALFALSAVQFATGWQADLRTFGAMCREREVLFVVDAIQALGAVPVRPHELGIDVLAAGGQKWLLSPWGTGFAWIAPQRILRHRLLHTGWLAYRAALDFSQLLTYDRDMLDDARRFEVGSLPYHDFLAFAHSLELLAGIGVERIATHVRMAQQPLLDWAAARDDVQCLHDDAHASGIVCVRLDGADRVFDALRSEGVQCAVREGVLRVAPHLYNDESDVRRVVRIAESSLTA